MVRFAKLFRLLPLVSAAAYPLQAFAQSAPAAGVTVASPAELRYLVWSTALALLYMAAQATAYRMQAGVDAANSTRDDEPAPNVLTGRATRAFRNFRETYVIFVVLCMVAVFAGRADALTYWGATLWFWARVVYLPAYLLGLSPYRSWIWGLSAIGLILMFVGLV